MCGLAGIVAYAHSAASVDPAELMRMRERMALRGPDAAGLWIADDASVGLAHRRLAIIDLSDCGVQPMWSACGRYCIVFNGEIYNFQILRIALERAGARFRSTSDTEVLLHLYEREGEGMCARLRGMFAFAIWDVPQQHLFLARDTFGIKPLYWHDDGKSFRFASQVKALLAGRGIENRIEPAAAAGYLIWGHVPEPWTTVHGVTSLPAGHWMRVQRNGRRVVREYESVSSLMRGTDTEPQDASAGIGEAVLDTVRHHLVSDVPVGIFLSAGIDSTAIAGLAAESGAQLRTVTLGFEAYRGTPGEETPLAERVARHYGADHQTIWVTRKDFVDELPRLLDNMDQPSIDGINTYFVSKAAGQAGLKVALSGLGGDELFSGYPSFTQIPRAVQRLAWAQRFPRIGAAFEAAFRGFPGAVLSPKYAGLLKYGGTYGGAYLLRRAMRLPGEALNAAFAGLDRDMVQIGLERLNLEETLQTLIAGMSTPLDKVSALETACYMRSQLLRDSDWASMAHSLEVRVPLVDRALTKRVVALRRAGVPPTKHDLAMTPHKPLPPGIINRTKTGFTVPVRDWLLAESGIGREAGLRGWQRFVWNAFCPSTGSVSQT